MAANTFVAKLAEECDKCDDFTDQIAIKTLRFKEDAVASHQILGLLFKDDVPVAAQNPLLKSFVPGLRLVKMGTDQTLKGLAFDPYSLGCLGQQNGTTLQRQLEITWHL